MVAAMLSAGVGAGHLPETLEDRGNLLPRYTDSCVADYKLEHLFCAQITHRHYYCALIGKLKRVVDQIF